jgi:hypothetical protein
MHVGAVWRVGSVAPPCASATLRGGSAAEKRTAKASRALTLASLQNDAFTWLVNVQYRREPAFGRANCGASDVLVW